MRTDTPVFTTPLDAAERGRAVASLRSAGFIHIDQCTLHLDEQIGLIWGVDPYGCDAVAGANTDATAIEDALDWVAYWKRPDRSRHPAEF